MDNLTDWWHLPFQCHALNMMSFQKCKKVSLNCVAICHSHSWAAAENEGQPDSLVAITLSLPHRIWCHSKNVKINCLVVYHSHSSAAPENDGQPESLVALTLSLQHWQPLQNDGQPDSLVALTLSLPHWIWCHSKNVKKCHLTAWLSIMNTYMQLRFYHEAWSGA